MHTYKNHLKNFIKTWASCFLLFNTWVFADLYKNPKGYEITTIPTPNGKPFHVSGLDQDKHGNIFVVTRMGEVWKWNGNMWQQFAEGMQEPCGLLCDDDGSILITQKPEFTRLRDLDKDGWADRYEVVCDEFTFFDSYHEFHYGPVKDSKGNYYCSLNLNTISAGGHLQSGTSSLGGYRGWIYKVDPQGEFTPFASGVRSPAGLAMGPKDRLFYTDNQGDWVETSKLDYVREGGFYGHPASIFQKEGYDLKKMLSIKPEELSEIRHLPTVWLPHAEVSNSPGNPEFDLSEGKFGPFKGQMFIGDHTNASIMRVMLQEVNGELQGAVVKFMQGFQSGVLRIKLDQQGRMWVGQTSRGWPTKGEKIFGVQRVDWNGQMPFEILKIEHVEGGFKVELTESYNKESITVDNLGIKSWWYPYRPNYGSPKIREKNIKATNLQHSDDGKSFIVKLPIEELNVYHLDLSEIKNKNGQSMANSEIYYTLKKKL